MEFVAPGLVQTVQDPQFSLLRQPAHCLHRFRLVRFFLSSPGVDLGLISLGAGGGGEPEQGEPAILGEPVDRTGLMILAV